jgi:hypothetical protein
MPLSRDSPQLRCRFYKTGFTLRDLQLRACHTRYHVKCVCAGLPFTTRLRKHSGLKFPAQIRDWPHFICEACTVRSVTGRELVPTYKDKALLMLERMRMIDLVSHWADGTHQSYQGKIRVLREFESTFQIPMLTTTPMIYPPNGLSIPLMWAQERYSLQPSTWKRSSNTSSGTVAYVTIRGLRSAASQFFALDLINSDPLKLIADHQSRPMTVPNCSPTDELPFTWFSDGMRRRLGDDSKPSTALLHHHIKWMVDQLEDLFRLETSSLQRCELCRAAIATLTGWLAWLRGNECFSLTWKDLTMLHPSLGPTEGLAEGLGMVGFRLLAQTKGDRTRTADVVVAWTTASRLSIGTWLTRLLLELEIEDPESCEDFIMCHPNGRPWDSHYFRHTYLYPFLATMRMMGDPYLQKYDGSPGMSLAEAFWSFHSYGRRGCRTAASRKREWNIRKASDIEVSEHGRWQISRQNMPMPMAYLEWSLPDRLAISQFCF